MDQGGSHELDEKGSDPGYTPGIARADRADVNGFRLVEDVRTIEEPKLMLKFLA